MPASATHLVVQPWRLSPQLLTDVQILIAESGIMTNIRDLQGYQAPSLVEGRGMGQHQLTR